MKDFNRTKIIGVDHGYGNIKTANHCFPAGVAAHDTEPLFTKDLLVFEGRYYLITLSSSQRSLCNAEQSSVLGNSHHNANF